MKKKKYTYWSILQGNYGYGWDDLIWYDRSKPEQIAEIKYDLKSYRKNQPGAYRIIRRRELNREFCK